MLITVSFIPLSTSPDLGRRGSRRRQAKPLTLIVPGFERTPDVHRGTEFLEGVGGDAVGAERLARVAGGQVSVMQGQDGGERARVLAVEVDGGVGNGTRLGFRRPALGS